MFTEMARISYGLQVQKRAKCLLKSLLIYANDELDISNEAVVDAIRPNIKIRWLTEKRLVIRTKVRFLQELTGLIDDKSILKPEQIKEALKRFTDFIEILEDNRTAKGGSENWHFTLNLWYSRWETEANLQQFDKEWEKRKRGQRDKVSHCVAEVPSVVASGTTRRETRGKDDKENIISPSSPHLPISPSSPSINWNEICRQTLERDNHRRLTTNPLTSSDGVTFALDEVYVPLGLVKRNQRERRSGDVHPGKGSQLYESEDGDVSETLTLDNFLQRLESKESSRIAVLGEPGAGKTTLIQKLLEQTPFGSVTITASGNNLWFDAINTPDGANFDPNTSGTGVGNGFGFDFLNGPSAKRYGFSVKATF